MSDAENSAHGLSRPVPEQAAAAHHSYLNASCGTSFAARAAG